MSFIMLMLCGIYAFYIFFSGLFVFYAFQSFYFCLCQISINVKNIDKVDPGAVLFRQRFMVCILMMSLC